MQKKMSASVKERASIPQVTTFNSSSSDNRKPTGKENTRSVSATRSSQKPFVKPVPIPQIDKSARDAAAGGVRRSTSSVPRGRSSSPSDFARLLSDRMSRVSVSDRSSAKSVNRARVSDPSKSKLKLDQGFENGSSGLGHSKYKGHNFLTRSADKEVSDSNGKSNVKIRALSKEVNLSSNSAIKSLKDKGYLDLKAKLIAEKPANSVNISETCSKVRNGESTDEMDKLDLSFKAVKENALNAVKVSEKVISEEGKGARASNKYSSKLHEKLAFLEGKVKRIASDIKKTKEMLDMNNVDTSKTIISDIQEKISGIEKAMGNVTTDKESILDGSKFVENNVQQSNVSETSSSKEGSHFKHSVKDLKREELEARLFPHHKLLRGRTSLNSSASSQNDRPHEEVVSDHSKVADVTLSPTEVNSIELEFLDALNEKTSKVSTRNAHAGLEFHEVQEMDGPASSSEKESFNTSSVRISEGEIRLTSDEIIEEFDDDQENRPGMVIEDVEESCMDQLNEICRKTSTGGWFVSEGESVLLAHDDGSCTYYDITNSEEKAEYKPPSVVSPNLWGDCWLIRAPDSDGCSGRYVVAASSGNTLDSGFCAWDFYSKDVRSFHVESENVTSPVRTVLGPLPNRGMHKRSSLSTIMSNENQQWWYKPCGHLLASTASSQRVVSIYDIRDGERVLKWEMQRPVITMDYSSPLQWRNRGKVVIAEAEAITLWDVNSLTPDTLLSITSSGRKVSALHVNNTDAELGGGVRRRVSSSEAEGHDGVFCTQDTINVLDFRLPSGIGLKISKIGVSVQSIFSRGDSIFLGCADGRLAVKEQPRSCIQQFSLRSGRLASSYALPESNAHFHHSAISQVWGNSDFAMGISGLGLFVFDALKDEAAPSIAVGNGKSHEVRDIIGPADLYAPSFDYSASRVLVISRDRPAMWRYLL